VSVGALQVTTAKALPGVAMTLVGSSGIVAVVVKSRLVALPSNPVTAMERTLRLCAPAARGVGRVKVVDVPALVKAPPSMLNW